MDVVPIFLGISSILFFGLLAEYFFKKTRIPDVLFLILLGIAIGPTWLNLISPDQVAFFAPLFTTFALLFLLYDGAFNINLVSLMRGLTKSMAITMFNFAASAAVTCGIMLIFGFDIKISILTGFILGGVSSAFVIPVLKNMGIKGEIYSVLTLESAMTDVLCIVFSLGMLEVIKANVIDLQEIITSIVSLFAVATFVGIIAGIFWILLVSKLLKDTKSYMVSIAYLIMIYVVTEFLNGNGAIAALVLGLVLRNSKKLTNIAGQIIKPRKKDENGETVENGYGIRVTSDEEEFFYSEISFFLKTFFFVYIGILINFMDTRAILIGGLISLGIAVSRFISYVPLRGMEDWHKKVASASFGRGLAAAAIVQFLVIEQIPGTALISNIVYAGIFFTLIISSIRLALLKSSFY